MRDGFIFDIFEIEKLKIEIKRLVESSDELNILETQKKQYMLNQREENMKFRERECFYIISLLKKLPKIYTDEEIEAAEKEYWEKRLSRQTFEGVISAQTGINQGNVRASIQAGTSLANFFLQSKQNILSNLKNAPQLNDAES